MPPTELHILGIDPGGTTGWAWLTVPRKSIYGDEPGQILEWDQGQVGGPEIDQVRWLARKIREIQGLHFGIGPAVVVEDFDVGNVVTTDAEVLYSPIRIAAMLRYARFMKQCGDANIVLQGRTMAMSTATDYRLEQWGLYVPGEEHARDAMRHAITLLRRVKEDAKLRDEAWNYLIT